MEFFTALGAKIERRWKELNYEHSCFPDLAAQALADSAPDKSVSPWDIVRWLFKTDTIPQQADMGGSFGYPPITLYSGPRFHIDIYYWLDGTTQIHQHAFCGAFQVFLGSSIHSQYSFRARRQVNQHLVVGQLSLKRVELLEQGTIQRILPGRHYIHSLFHLDRPSATICVRTRGTAIGEPQYSYLKPWFASDPFFQEPLTVKQIQAISLLFGMRHPDTDDLLRELLANSDFQTTFKMLDLAYSHLSGDRLQQAFGVTSGETRFNSLMESARQRHGQLVDLVMPVIEEGRRQSNIAGRRGQITSPEHRFFLALLLNVPDRVKLLALVKQRFPKGDPVETVLEWVEELANTRAYGSSESNVLGIEDFGDDYLFVLQGMLKGQSLTTIKNDIARTLPKNERRGSGHRVEELMQSIRRSMMFKAMFPEIESARKRDVTRAPRRASKKRR